MNTTINPKVYEKLLSGGFIPAHPLALNPDLSIDEDSQRRLTRYYISCGVDGIAIGVHTTQFEIRDSSFNYYRRVLEICSDEISRSGTHDSFIKVAGICGPVSQAIEEAKIAKELGYDLGLLSMGGLNDLTENELIERTKIIAQIIPVFGFYLQPSVGGRMLSYNFWGKFCEIENVLAIKTAPFNRYNTLEVVRAVCNSKREHEIALYTGNDDNIINDLITTYKIKVGDSYKEKRIVGGLLGHYSVWTKTSLEIFNSIKQGLSDGTLDIQETLKLGINITDMNSAIFDTANSFKGSISGIHEVLRRQGLLKGIWCLSPKENLSEGQIDEIDRVIDNYPYLVDDDYVKKFLVKDSDSNA